MRWVVPIVLAGLVSLTGWLHERALERRAQFPAAQDLLYAPPPRHLELISLGYREALADLLWIRALVFAGSHVGDMQLAWVERYVDGIATLAPRFHRPYRWGGVLSIYGGSETVDREMVEHAIAIYRRGLEHFPESHELLYALGMLLIHQVPTTPGYSEAEIAKARQEGAELIRRAAAFGADPLVRQYATTLLTEHGADELAIQFLEAQLLETDDEDYRHLLETKLARLEGGEAARTLERLREQFVQERDRIAPYVPEPLWAVIRPHRRPMQ